MSFFCVYGDCLTTEAEPFIQRVNAYIDSLWMEGKHIEDSFFLELAVFLSHLNIKQQNGGPFGAVIVVYEDGLDSGGKGSGKPVVIGVGANHVIPYNDPTAHAEMEAYRDAARRKGCSDLQGAVLFTSCECCPMCLSIANGSGISKIIYANTRDQAEAIDFSDRLQYALFRLPRKQMMTSVYDLPENRRGHIKSLLGGYGAAVLDENDNVYAYGSADTHHDPTAIASLSAIRMAVKRYAKAHGPSYFLPEGFTLVCRYIPHPAGLIAADWARMLRKWDKNNPDNPACDAEIPDPSRIIYLSDGYEPLPVVNTFGVTYIRQPTEVTYQQPSLDDAQREVETYRLMVPAVCNAAASVFDEWKIAIINEEQKRY